MAKYYEPMLFASTSRHPSNMGIMAVLQEPNYHMTAFKYEGNAFAVEMSHVISDGSGAIPYFKSVLYLYLSRKTGLQFDPAGFHLSGDPISENETGDPFPSLDPYIREIFYLSQPDAFDVQIEIACINGSFCLVYAQSFLSEVFFEAFLQELEEAGIPVVIIHKDSCPLSGVRFDGIEEEKQEKIKAFFEGVFRH